MKRRLFIVSNRLPVNIEKDSDGSKTVKPTSGGLVSAINSYLKKIPADFNETFWVGVPGCEPMDWGKTVDALNTNSTHFIPVYATNKLYQQYYNGFSNTVLWPLFHYFPSYAEYNVECYDSYIKVNTLFADTLQKHLRPTDVLWIHDYHLLPLAGMIRERIPEISIGFFLHIPFPSYEIFRMMPKHWQKSLLKGMLGADLIGFHTIDYTMHFLKTVQMVFGYEHDLNVIRHNNRLIKADVFPISIDYKKFNSAFDDEQVKRLRNELQSKLLGKQIIFSVDRLDYTKGLSNRLQGYALFLERYPEFKETVVFVMVIVPSREDILKYAERKEMVDVLISNINSKVGTIHWQPVIYQYQSLTFREMLALYTACDLALITPLRDGMNLVAKEFVASRKDKKGVLILSEMAGAARELTNAININPNDIDELADKIRTALQMPLSEQETRIEAMQCRIQQYDVTTWAKDFIDQLDHIKTKQLEFQIKFIDYADKNLLYTLYQRSAKRLFLLDYDGTLANFSNQPEHAIPSKKLKEILHHLSSDNANEVYIISGRSSITLENWFSDIPVHLIAEHGSKLKMKSTGWLDILKVPHNWKEPVLKIIDLYVKRCANTFIEQKEYSICWHYRSANNEHGKLRARELYNELYEYSGQLGLEVIMGNKIVEVKVNGANKASVLRHYLLSKTHDFIFAAGDDKTDEDMFKVLADLPQSYTIKVGPDASYAKYNLHTPEMVVCLLENLAISGATSGRTTTKLSSPFI